MAWCVLCVLVLHGVCVGAALGIVIVPLCLCAGACVCVCDCVVLCGVVWCGAVLWCVVLSLCVLVLVLASAFGLVFACGSGSGWVV